MSADAEREVAGLIWHTSRDDESTISATGANIVARAILDSEWLAGMIADAKAEAWDERDRARATYPDPHPEDCAGWEDCWCGYYPNPYRTESAR